MKGSKELHEEDNQQPLVTTPGFKSKLVWPNIVVVSILHLAYLYGICCLSHKLKLLTWMWCVILSYLGGFSITLGCHRMYAHRAFKANVWVRVAVIILQSLAGQDSVWHWVRDHRLHHKYTETNADPHNSNRGFFFAHVGWLMMKKHPDVITKGRTIDLSDIEQDSIVMFQERYYKTFFVLFCMIIPVAVPYYLWNETLWNAFFAAFIGRLVVSLNISFLVNSAAHMYGTRPYSKYDLVVIKVAYAFCCKGLMCRLVHI